MSPLKVLGRGYAIVTTVDGAVVRTLAQVASGVRVTTRLARGRFDSTVEVLHPAQDGEPRDGQRR